MYAAQGDATTLAEACLDLDTVDSLTLAADISEEALKLGSKTRKELKRRLEQGLESNDPEKARLAAQVCLNQRLKKNFRSLDDRRAIDTTMINCAEYQLFLDDMRKQEEYRQPDH